MKLLSLVLLLSLGQQSPDTSAFTDPYLGLVINHSKDWTQLKNVKDIVRFSIPIEGSSDTAELQIMRRSFHDTKEVWRTIQIHANESMHRDVVRQWEQDVINVPLLCTQISFTEKGQAKTTLTGLYYTKTPTKLLVRLTSPTESFEKVRAEFMKTLESLHTTNGAMPLADDPNFEFVETKKPQLAAVKPFLIDQPRTPAARVFKDQVIVPMVVSTKSVQLKLPQGWTAGEVKDGVLTIQYSKVPCSIKIEVHSSLDSDRPSVALNKATSQELADFLPGVARQDTDPVTNEAGCAISTVWRTGKDAKGPLVTLHASGEQGEFYFLTSYRTVSPAEARQAHKLIAALFEEISLNAVSP